MDLHHQSGGNERLDIREGVRNAPSRIGLTKKPGDAKLYIVLPDPVFSEIPISNAELLDVAGDDPWCLCTRTWTIISPPSATERGVPTSPIPYPYQSISEEVPS